MLYRPLAFYRETCVFPPVGPEKPMEILRPILAQVITLARPTSTPNLVEIGCQGAPPHSGEISHFYEFCSPFFYIYFFICFLISPTGRNFQPICTLYSSNDMFCFVNVPFFLGGGFGAFKFFFRGSPAQKTPTFRPVFGLCRFAAEIASALEPSRVNCP